MLCFMEIKCSYEGAKIASMLIMYGEVANLITTGSFRLSEMVMNCQKVSVLTCKRLLMHLGVTDFYYDKLEVRIERCWLSRRKFGLAAKAKALILSVGAVRLTLVSTNIYCHIQKTHHKCPRRWQRWRSSDILLT